MVSYMQSGAPLLGLAKSIYYGEAAMGSKIVAELQFHREIKTS